MMRKRYFSRDFVRRVNARMMAGEKVDLSRFPPEVARIIQETHFTAAEINQAFAAARRTIENRINSGLKHEPT